MPQSYTSLHYHLVFSTKDRQPLITPVYQQRLYDYQGGIIRSEDGTLLAANGTANHVHLLTTLHKERSTTEMMRIIKARSSAWLHETFPELRHFAWQPGYGAFSISVTGLSRVKSYLAQQEAHHRTVTFQEEFIDFLERHQIAYDVRYLWKQEF